jgi:fatty-acyl-CoA synthase
MSNPGEIRRAPSTEIAGALTLFAEPTQRVMVWAPNCPEWSMLQLGSALAGTVLVAVDPALGVNDLAYALQQSRARVVFHAGTYRGRQMRDVLDAVLPECPELREVIQLDGVWLEQLGSEPPACTPLPHVRPDDPAMLLYTSGTNGVPKGALLSHRAIANSARFVANALLLEPEDRWVNPLPLSYSSSSVVAALGTVATGSCHVPSARSELDAVLQVVRAHEGTVLSAAPTLLAQLGASAAKKPGKLPTLRAIVTGGTSVPPALIRSVESDLGLRVSTVYDERKPPQSLPRHGSQTPP